MMLIGETATDINQYVGMGIIGIILIVLNQVFSMLQKARDQQATLEAAKLLATTQARRDEVAIKKDEFALCAAEDDHVVSGYEKLLSRTNQRLTEVEKELADVYIKLGQCEKEHARTEERCKHFEQRMAILETKYMALRKKIPGIDSDTILAPEEPTK